MWYTFPTVPTCFYSKMAAESHLGNTVWRTWALLLTLSPIPNPRKGWENKGSHVLNILCHSIQVYHSFPLSLPWPQRWGNDLICLLTHRNFWVSWKILVRDFLAIKGGGPGVPPALS